MSSTFAIDINVRFYDFLQKKHFSFPSYQQLCFDVFMVGTQGKLLTFRFIYISLLQHTLIYISCFFYVQKMIFLGCVLKNFYKFSKDFCLKSRKRFPFVQERLNECPTLPQSSLFQLFFKLENHMQKGIVSQCSSRTAAPKFSSADCF